MAISLPTIAADVRASIEARLAVIEREHGVRILFAVESGSRAWGFPSPDSDYDVRFVYAHPVDWYLRLRPGRDVIERPIDGELDIGGWDLRKALTLLLKPNPVLLEWLSSPIRYRWDDTICASLMALSRRVTHTTACLHHYLHLGEGQWKRDAGNGAEIRYKQYFYSLRPALAIRWLRQRPESVPPMNLQALIAGLELQPAVQDAIAGLVVRKRTLREIGTGPRVMLLDDLISREFDWARSVPRATCRQALHEEADRLFRTIVRGPA